MKSLKNNHSTTMNENNRYEFVEERYNDKSKKSNEKSYFEVNNVEKNIEALGLIDNFLQLMSTKEIVSNIEKSSEYVVQIPRKFKESFNSGEVFIAKNKKTGIEWPILMKKTNSGQYRFVADLPIKKREFIKSEVFRDFSINYHNIVIQQQLAEISQSIEETYQTVKFIEQGQQDDRIALIDAGREQVLLAMTLANEKDKKELLRFAVRDLTLGKEQIGKSLSRRLEEFTPIPNSELKIFLNVLKDVEYLNKKDKEIEDIQECYSLYIEATKMLAAIFEYFDEKTAVRQVFDQSLKFIRDISFEKLKSIEYSHKNVNFSDWFFNYPEKYIEIEKALFLEESKNYDFIQIELSGKKLLEGIIDNEKIQKE